MVRNHGPNEHAQDSCDDTRKRNHKKVAQLRDRDHEDRYKDDPVDDQTDNVCGIDVRAAECRSARL